MIKRRCLGPIEENAGKSPVVPENARVAHQNGVCKSTNFSGSSPNAINRTRVRLLPKKLTEVAKKGPQTDKLYQQTVQQLESRNSSPKKVQLILFLLASVGNDHFYDTRASQRLLCSYKEGFPCTEGWRRVIPRPFTSPESL